MPVVAGTGPRSEPEAKNILHASHVDGRNSVESSSPPPGVCLSGKLEFGVGTRSAPDTLMYGTSISGGQKSSPS